MVAPERVWGWMLTTLLDVSRCLPVLGMCPMIDEMLCRSFKAGLAWEPSGEQTRCLPDVN